MGVFESYVVAVLGGLTVATVTSFFKKYQLQSPIKSSNIDKSQLLTLALTDFLTNYDG